MFVSATDSTDISLSPVTTTPGGSTYEPLNTSVNEPVSYEQLPTTSTSTYEQLQNTETPSVSYEQLPTRAAAARSVGHEHEHDYYNINN